MKLIAGTDLELTVVIARLFKADNYASFSWQAADFEVRRSGEGSNPTSYSNCRSTSRPVN